MLAAVYAFYRYVKRRTIGRMILVGFAVGLAMTAKFAGVFIVPVLCLIAALTTGDPPAALPRLAS
jgi:4-amino-4-deoxy-L-arabinose transferase-like glycosyltransferase